MILFRLIYTAADFARRLVIYACLAVVLAAGYVLDLIDPEGDTPPPAV